MLFLRRAWLAVAITAALAAFDQTPARAESDLETVTITSGGEAHVFQVEIAKDEAQRAQGLMNRRFMPANRGMLFEFEQNAPVSFWMKNTYIPLDMIFIARDGKITHIEANTEPFSEAIISSQGPAFAVLEVNAGAASKLGLKVGDVVKHALFKR